MPKTCINMEASKFSRKAKTFALTDRLSAKRHSKSRVGSFLTASHNPNFHNLINYLDLKMQTILRVYLNSCHEIEVFLTLRYSCLS